MSDLVRVGLLGRGHIAETHVEVLAERPDVSLEFTVDPNPGETPEFRGSKPPNYDNLPQALESHRPDLVVIATPTDTHVDLATQALTMSTARILVEKPLVHSLDALTQLRGLDAEANVRNRVFTAHHFAFSPEVRWAAELLADHPDWGPVTVITSAFYDPYILRGEQAFASYGSSWMDSGVNQLSMLASFVELTEATSADQSDGGASAWCTFAFSSQGTLGTARLRTSWLTGSSSKKTTLSLDRTGVEIWLDHTAMTGFATREGQLLATYGNDGRTARKIAHYRPLYESLLSDEPAPVLSFDIAVQVTELHHAAPGAC